MLCVAFEMEACFTKHTNMSLSRILDLLSFSSEAIFNPVQADSGKTVVAVWRALFRIGWSKTCLLERGRGKAQSWGWNDKLRPDLDGRIWPKSPQRRGGKKTSRFSGSWCGVWLPAAHRVLEDALLVPLHPPQDVPAVRGHRATARPPPAGPSPLQEGVREPAALPGRYHSDIYRFLRTGSGAMVYLIQFNSIQFICIAQFHKLQICLRVLYDLYT